MILNIRICFVLRASDFEFGFEFALCPARFLYNGQLTTDHGRNTKKGENELALRFTYMVNSLWLRAYSSNSSVSFFPISLPKASHSPAGHTPWSMCFSNSERKCLRMVTTGPLVVLAKSQ
jgi:hypothetical protein